MKLSKRAVSTLRRHGIDVYRDHVKESGFTAEQREAYRASGEAAFADGLGAAPALNAQFAREVCELATHDAKCAAMKLYTDGWTRANLAAPVPGIDD